MSRAHEIAETKEQLYALLRLVSQFGVSHMSALEALEQVAAELYAATVSGAKNRRESLDAARIYSEGVRRLRAGLPSAETDADIEGKLRSGG